MTNSTTNTGEEGCCEIANSETVSLTKPATIISVSEVDDVVDGETIVSMTESMTDSGEEGCCEVAKSDTISLTKQITTLKDGSQRVKIITEVGHPDGSRTKTIKTEVVPFATEVDLADDSSDPIPIALPGLPPLPFEIGPSLSFNRSRTTSADIQFHDDTVLSAALEPFDTNINSRASCYPAPEVFNHNRARSTTADTNYSFGLKEESVLTAAPEPDINEAFLVLPVGLLGIRFSGSPPEVTSVATNSALLGQITVGQIICGVVIDGHTEVELDQSLLAGILQSSSENEGRVLILRENLVWKQATATQSVEKIKLPAGDLGLQFSGSPAEVTQIAKDSPLADKLKVGKIMRGLIIPGEIEVSGLGTPVLTNLFKHFQDNNGRILVVTEKPNDNELINFVAKITLPIGDIGVSFDGTPAVVSSIDESSPLKMKVNIGQVVERIEVPGVFESSIISANVLTGWLKNFSSVDGRVLVVKELHEQWSFNTDAVVINSHFRKGATDKTAVKSNPVSGASQDSRHKGLYPRKNGLLRKSSLTTSTAQTANQKSPISFKKMFSRIASFRMGN